MELVGLGMVKIVRKNSESKMQTDISQTIQLTWMVPFYFSSRFQTSPNLLIAIYIVFTSSHHMLSIPHSKCLSWSAFTPTPDLYLTVSPWLPFPSFPLHSTDPQCFLQMSNRAILLEEHFKHLGSWLQIIQSSLLPAKQGSGNLTW